MAYQGYSHLSLVNEKHQPTCQRQVCRVINVCFLVFHAKHANMSMRHYVSIRVFHSHRHRDHIQVVEVIPVFVATSSVEELCEVLRWLSACKLHTEKEQGVPLLNRKQCLVEYLFFYLFLCKLCTGPQAATWWLRIP